MLSKKIWLPVLYGSFLFLTANGQNPDAKKEEPWKRLEIIIQPQKPPPEPVIVNGEKCSGIVGGWQFCTTTPLVSTDSPKNVPVILKVKNKSQGSATIVHGNFNDYYVATVFDPNGESKLSYGEEIAKRVKEGKATEEDLREELPINSAPRIIELAPNENYNVEFNLAQFYDFSMKGKYKVKLRRKITTQDTQVEFVIACGTIEVEIK